jgi:hypothetical protein
VASSTISRGYDPNAEAIAHGALKDLVGFEPVLVQAIKFDEKLEAEDDPGKWLAIPAAGSSAPMRGRIGRNGQTEKSNSELKQALEHMIAFDFDGTPLIFDLDANGGKCAVAGADRLRN